MNLRVKDASGLATRFFELLGWIWVREIKLFMEAVKITFRREPFLPSR